MDATTIIIILLLFLVFGVWNVIGWTVLIIGIIAFVLFEMINPDSQPKPEPAPQSQPYKSQYQRDSEKWEKIPPNVVYAPLVPESQSIPAMPDNPSLKLVNFVNSYYEALDKGNVESALSKWKKPSSKIAKMVRNIDSFKVNNVKILYMNTNNANVWIDVTGKNIGESEEHWQGLILLESVATDDWRIIKFKDMNKLE